MVQVGGAHSVWVQQWERIRGDNRGVERGSRSRAGLPQRRQGGSVCVPWLCAGTEDFRNVGDVTLGHWDSREREMRCRPMH